MRKPVFGVADQVPHKPGFIATDGLEILDLANKALALSMCSENKDADRVHSHHAADLRLCFCISLQDWL